MTELIISVSGLRGVVGDSLTPDVAARYAAAFASTLPPGPVLLTRDGRSSGPMLIDALRSSLVAFGRTLLDAGVAATPTTGVLLRDHNCAGAIQVSASHNPAQYNGLKLFGKDGRVLPTSKGKEVKRRFLTDDFSWTTHERLGGATSLEDTTSAHLRLLEKVVDVQRIRACGFSVLLDANHGAGGVLGRPLLEALGCRVILLGESPDGQFEHLPEPTAANLAGVLSRVPEEGADIGFCQDPDADRLAIISERGRYLGEECTLALAVDHLLRSRPGPIVTNCSTSRMTEDLARKHGVAFHRSAVGEANVVDKMLEVDAVLGGEGNGGVIDPRVGLVRDSFVGMALILEAMAIRHQAVDQLVEKLPCYALCKMKMTVSRDRIPAALDALEKHFANAVADRLDGLRLDWPEERRWLLVRASNTEPILRIFCEAKTAESAAEVCKEAEIVMA